MKAALFAIMSRSVLACRSLFCAGTVALAVAAYASQLTSSSCHVKSHRDWRLLAGHFLNAGLPITMPLPTQRLRRLRKVGRNKWPQCGRKFAAGQNVPYETVTVPLPSQPSVLELREVALLNLAWPTQDMRGALLASSRCELHGGLVRIPSEL